MLSSINLPALKGGVGKFLLHYTALHPEVSMLEVSMLQLHYMSQSNFMHHKPLCLKLRKF